MKKILSLLSPGLVGSLLLLVSCQQAVDPLPYKDQAPNLPTALANYAAPSLPAHVDPTMMQEKMQTITDAGATLGRVLFFDNKLSVNNQVSCGSCHQQAKGFSDQLSLSPGFEGQLTTRNSPSLVNLINQNSFFWDSRAKSLEDLIGEPIRNHIEMGMEDLSELEIKLSATSYYPALFEQAFGSPEVREERIASAMSQFLKSMLSYRSQYDEIMSSSGVFPPQAAEGQWIFFGKGRCYQCHGGVDFRSGDFGFFDPFQFNQENWANIGLDETYQDPGLGKMDETQVGVFKVPSLRNLAFTAPYMHDGRFATLEEVVEHYNGGISAHPMLDWRLTNGINNEPIEMGLTETDKANLLAFLELLNDEALLTDARFSDPFSD